MTRQEIYQDMERTLGLVPTFMKSIPDDSLEEEWSLFKKIELGESRIPNKYKELIGIAVSAATKCRYCILFHTEVARLAGASDEEIEEAVHYAKMTTGWSTYIQGMETDYETFRDEIRRAVEFVRNKHEQEVAAGV